MVQQPAPPSDSRQERVAEVLARVRAGVRQRQGELSTGIGSRDEVRMRLLELRAHEFLQQPPGFSPRPLVGPLLVLARKALFKLFLKWYLHPVMQQQNRFNQVASRLIQELVESNDQLRRRVAELEERQRGGGGDAAP